jgi:hypothetical protein
VGGTAEKGVGSQETEITRTEFVQEPFKHENTFLINERSNDTSQIVLALLQKKGGSVKSLFSANGKESQRRVSQRDHRIVQTLMFKTIIRKSCFIRDSGSRGTSGSGENTNQLRTTCIQTNIRA